MEQIWNSFCCLIYNNPFAQSVNAGWYKEKIVYYLLLDPVVVDPKKTLVKDIYQFILGFDQSGNPLRVAGQFNIIDVVPFDPDYSPLWRVVFVIVPSDYTPQSIRSVDAIIAGGFPTQATNMIINCPVL